jgi:predicted Zn-dependent protease
MAAMIVGLLAASRAGNSGADVANAVLMGSQAAMMQGQLNFSRDMEREADRVGYGLYSGAGFAPAGVAAMFEKLDNAFRLNDGGTAFPYLRTHPLTTERIGEARARVEAGGPGSAARASFEHAFMQGRSRALMDTSEAALRRQQAADQVSASASAGERLAALVASATASNMLREPARALTAIRDVQAVMRGTPRSEPRAERALLALQAETLQTRGDAAGALALLDRVPDGSRVQLLMRAEAALGLPRSDAADAELRRSTELLQTWVTEHRADALAWGLLAQSADRLGLSLRAVRAQAESRAALGDIGGAIDRLRAGQRLARTASTPADHIEMSIIDTRARELETLRRQQLAELRGGRRPDQ